MIEMHTNLFNTLVFGFTYFTYEPMELARVASDHKGKDRADTGEWTEETFMNLSASSTLPDENLRVGAFLDLTICGGSSGMGTTIRLFEVGGLGVFAIEAKIFSGLSIATALAHVVCHNLELSRTGSKRGWWLLDVQPQLNLIEVGGTAGIGILFACQWLTMRGRALFWQSGGVHALATSLAHAGTLGEQSRPGERTTHGRSQRRTACLTSCGTGMACQVLWLARRAFSAGKCKRATMNVLRMNATNKRYANKPVMMPKTDMAAGAQL